MSELKGGALVRRVALVGAGNIAQSHTDVLKALAGTKVTAVIDPHMAAAEGLARRVGGVAFSSVEEALEKGDFDVAHVLTPPATHAGVAAPLLSAGKSVLLEKPLATSTEDANELLRLAKEKGATLGINQNFVFDPAFTKLMRYLEAGKAGPLRSVTCIYSMPLRQLSAGQFGHWMFREPKNLLLEQAVHPLSQILQLTGSIKDLTLKTSDIEWLNADTPFCRSTLAILEGERASAQFEFSMGAEYPTWQIIACCDDATLTADVIQGQFRVQGRTRWIEPMDRMLVALRGGAVQMVQGVGALLSYGLSLLKLKKRSDSFFRSMSASIASFYKGLDDPEGPRLSGTFGAELVDLCERMARIAGWPVTEPANVPASDSADYDVLVIGGTGFIGRALVPQLLAAGHKVGVMARNVEGLDDALRQPGVHLVRGNISDKAAIEAAIGDARSVINLAHGGGGADFDAIREAMVGGALRVAEACVARSVDHLLQVGSIAGLNLGDPALKVTATTPPDPNREARADYARAKAESDEALLAYCERQGLGLTIVRPGVVVGAGGPAFHTGVGFFNNDQHTLGWNGGRNPLPFVLVEDVASGLVKCLKNEKALGKTYNLIGDVRLSAREYVDELARATKRPLVFHPQPTELLFSMEFGKWLIKKVAGGGAARPTLYDLKSRSMLATFDTTTERADLDWSPVSDRAIFVERAILVHGATD